MHVAEVPQGHMTKTSATTIPKVQYFFKTVLNSLLPAFPLLPKESLVSLN